MTTEKKAQEVMGPVEETESGQDGKVDLSTVGPPLQAEDIKEAKRPDGMPEADAQKISERVADAVRELGTTMDRVQEQNIVDRFANIGLEKQEQIALNLGLEQEKVGVLIEGHDEYSTTVKSGIDKLDETLKQFAREAADVGITERIVQRIPVFGTRLARMARNERRKRRTIREFCKSMENQLRAGRGGLNQNNVEMKVVLATYEKLQLEIRRQAYFAELLAKGVQDLISKTTDQRKLSFLRNVHFYTVTRARDLRQYEESYEGYFAIIAMSSDVNRQLMSILTRLLTMGMPQMSLGLIMRAVLVRQREGIAAAKQTSETLSNLYVANARMINQHISSIGEIYKLGPIDPQKAAEAYAQILEALVNLDKIKSEAIPVAKAQIEQSKQRTRELQERTAGTRAAGISSLEIDDLPTRPVGRAERATI